MDKAAVTALAPGMVNTGTPASRADRTSLYPGSEISGVPASDTKATTAPRAAATKDSRSTSPLWSLYRRIFFFMPK